MTIEGTERRHKSTAKPERQSSTPTIRRAPGIRLRAVELRLLRSAFSASESIFVEREFRSGYSGALVLLVSLDSAQAPVVVKLAHPHDLDREYNAYLQFVEKSAPQNTARLQGPPIVVTDSEDASQDASEENSQWGADQLGADQLGADQLGADQLGALLYTFAGGDPHLPTSSLQEYIESQGPDATVAMLNRLFRVYGRHWWAINHPHKFVLGEHYDHLLPVHLEVALALTDKPISPVKTFAAGEVSIVDVRSVRIGDALRLHNFRVTKNKREAGTITLQADAPEGEASPPLRVRVVGTHALRVRLGELLAVVNGRVVASRHTLLADAAVNAMPTYAANQDLFAAEVLATGVGLPGAVSTISQSKVPLRNPLRHLDLLLDRVVEARMSTVHGDMNLCNVLIDEQTGFAWLIDFADTKLGPTVFDLQRLEVQIFTKLLADQLDFAFDGVASVANLIFALHADPPSITAPDPAHQDLYTLLVGIRRLARQYLMDDLDWDEYYQGLTVALVGALKFDELDDRARSTALTAAATTKALLGVALFPARALPTSLARPASVRFAETGGLSATHATHMEPVSEVSAGAQPVAPLEEMCLHNFPPAQTSFIGREDTIEQIIERLMDTETRLITITGPGGVGKSRLAAEAVQRCQRRVDGVNDAFFVSLGSITNQNGIWQALGESMDVQPQSEGLIEDDIVAFVRENGPLIVLDNYEQLMPDTHCIESLLAKVSELHLLVTSRVPLNLGAEWRLPLDGLAVPPETAQDPIEGGDLAVSPYPAIDLLVSTAQRVAPGFTVTDENRADLGRICRALAGMPLAIEMASSWLALFTPAMLAEQIDDNLGVLVSTRRDIPERQRSLRAIFDHTLSQLPQSEGALLVDLTVFRDSFSLPAAIAVAAVSFEALKLFDDHALIQRRADNRFSLHPVLLVFLRERASDLAAVRERHAAYYLQLLAAENQNSDALVVDSIGREIANVRAAWKWATSTISTDETNLLSAALDGLLAYYKFRGGYGEGQLLFSEAAEAAPSSIFANRARLAEAEMRQRLGDQAGALSLVGFVLESEIPETRLAALIAAAWLNEQRTEYDLAIAQLQEALELADPNSREAGQIWGIFGAVYRYRGSMDARLDAHKRALSISIGLQDELQSAENHDTLGMIYKDTGEYDEAIDHFQQAISIVKRLEYRERMARFTLHLGMTYGRMGEPDRIDECYQEALAIAKALNHKRLLCSCVGCIGVVAKQRRDYDVALHHYRQAIQLAEELDDKSLQAVYRGNLGNAYMDLGQYERAISYLGRAAELDRSMGAMGGAARHLGNIGDALKFQHRYAEAVSTFESAIPDLRLSGNTFFLCWVLVSCAECLLELGDVEAAQPLNAEGGHLAAETGREFYQLLSILLAERMQVNGENLQSTITRIGSLRSRFWSPDMVAEIDYVLWRIVGNAHTRKTAAESCLRLYESTKIMRHYARYTMLISSDKVNADVDAAIM